MRLVLVRHGETEHNRQHLVLGSADPPLSELGLRQAAALARELFERHKVTAVYTSPQLRSHATATAIAHAFGLVPSIANDLRELDVGEIEGLTAGEVAERHPDFLSAWSGTGGADVKLPGGGESLSAVQERAWAVVEKIRTENEGDITVVAVSHSMVIHTVVCRVLSMPLAEWRRFDQALASVTTIDFRPNRAIVTAINDTCHLEAIE